MITSNVVVDNYAQNYLVMPVNGDNGLNVNHPANNPHNATILAMRTLRDALGYARENRGHNGLVLHSQDGRASVELLRENESSDYDGAITIKADDSALLQEVTRNADKILRGRGLSLMIFE